MKITGTRSFARRLAAWCGVAFCAQLGLGASGCDPFPLGDLNELPEEEAEDAAEANGREEDGDETAEPRYEVVKSGLAALPRAASGKWAVIGDRFYRGPPLCDEDGKLCVVGGTLR